MQVIKGLFSSVCLFRISLNKAVRASGGARLQTQGRDRANHFP